MPDDYAQSLPRLPVDLLRNRVMLGGLLRKKAKERERASGLAGGTELYKLGVVKAAHMSVRNYVGQGIDPRARAGKASKVLMTSEWMVRDRQYLPHRA